MRVVRHNPSRRLSPYRRAMTIVDSEDKLQELCATLGVGLQDSSCLTSRGLASPSDLAFGVPDTDSL